MSDHTPRAAQNSFGRRQTSVGGESVLRPRTAPPKAEAFRFRSEADAALKAHETAEAVAERFVAKFNWWLVWVAFGILLAGVAAVKDQLLPASKSGFQNIPLTSFDTPLFFFSGLLMIVIGAVWFAKGLLGREALVMTDHHVRGFTLYGPKTIRWEDIADLRVASHGVYGKEVQIHAARGTPSSSIFLNCIPLYVGLTDRTIEEIIEAVRAFRPDVPIT